MDRVVALVPAKDRADSVAATVAALRQLPAVHRVLVVDDGSTDATAERARAAGAEVLRLARSRGKGGAVLAGVAAAPETDVFLLIDADLAATAVVADQLLAPVLSGQADMTVGVLPAAAGRGGFGLVRAFAAAGIRRACGRRTMAPLSGQRAVRADILRGLGDAPRFGLEVALTIHAVRAGARVLDVPVAMEHRHTGRSWRGFAHRGRQGADITRALWPRLTSSTQRIGVIFGVGAVLMAAMVWSGARAQPSSAAPTAKAAKVVVFGIPRLGLDDLAIPGRMPNLSRLARQGAVSANSVRTLAAHPSAAEAYATIGAGVRVGVPAELTDARMADEPVEGGTAREVVSRRTGRRVTGEVVVVNGPATIRNVRADLGSRPGALGQALEDAHEPVAVVTNADTVDETGQVVVNRPAAVAVMNATASVDHGDVRGTAGAGPLSPGLLRRDAGAPFGLRADAGAVKAQVDRALTRADLVVVDPGDTERAGQYGAATSAATAEQLRRVALARTDDILGRVAASLPRNTLLLVMSVSPPSQEWALTPMVAHGAGVRHGYLHSSSTRRLGLTTITDVAPTVLATLGVKQPTSMVGAPLRYHPGDGALAPLVTLNHAAVARERTYLPTALTFIVVQALAYLFIILVLWRRTLEAGTESDRHGHHGSPPRAGRLTGGIRLLVLAFAAWPLATFLYRALPLSRQLGQEGQAVIWALALLAAAVAGRARSHPLTPLLILSGATVALTLIDVATGGYLQMSSVLGYSPHTSGRYTGVGNTAFAVLAATAIIAGLVHVHHAAPHRRTEALATTAVLFALVVVCDGWPTLGADFGGTLTLVPIFALCVVAMLGRRVRFRTVALAVLGTVLTVAALIALDLLRAPDQRTHVGRFVSGILNDHSTFFTTVGRKWQTNMRVFRGSIWTWTVPIISLFLVYVLVIAGGWERLLPRPSAVRVAVVGTLFAGVLGWLTNDSGVVVTALAFVFIAPFITLLALAPPLSASALAAEPTVPSAVIGV